MSNDLLTKPQDGVYEEVGLATKLREGTKKAHTMAENVGFVKCFLKGVVEKESYRKLLGNFYFIYSALEEEFERHRRHPVLKALYLPELWRKESLEQDMAYYFGPNWRNTIAPSPVGKEYVECIRHLSNTDPDLLVAHSYTRYLGDLSGGQILKNIAIRAMGLEGSQGTAFYEFAEIPDAKAFKTAYREALDQLPVSSEKADAIVAEANAAFKLNMRLFNELEGNLIKAIGVMLFNSLTRRRGAGSTELTPAAE
ncbi:heme oxygenase (biliverdin-producing) [Leptolyngbya sp. FACHB-261]|uniref:biliverdin-producing heme oxygenase n=1 Tax=Leptolyngbya sp. FACHB-261 TaxID=2692806 RepID=UPI001686F71A|nr:heme oxygenase (biliverdin-producing) [Leptolyngbya sp. FACHB-261]MBD2103682.1 heme oxygenase (biliverdin-producing) [Leptolyngbya sp. FACHB-261]